MTTENNTGIVVGSTTTNPATITTTAPHTGNEPAQSQSQPIEFDYDKLASIIEGKQNVAEDAVLKGYFKEQGLTGDEMKEAIEMFKQDKASRRPDINALNQQIADGESALLEAESRALFAETQMEAMRIASELGVEQKTIPYLMRMADLSDVITDGQPDEDKLRESLNGVLKDLPQLKAAAEDKASGFKVGADTSGNQKASSNDELAQIFGVKKG